VTLGRYEPTSTRWNSCPARGWPRCYGGTPRTVNSIHHQGVKDLAPGFVVEARCPDDGMVEAFRRTTPGAYVAGVQWHPEFHDPPTPAPSTTRRCSPTSWPPAARRADLPTLTPCTHAEAIHNPATGH
jgi:putative glutamine amidotransferase